MLYRLANTLGENRRVLGTYLGAAILNHGVHEFALALRDKKYYRLPLTVLEMLAALGMILYSQKRKDSERIELK